MVEDVDEGLFSQGTLADGFMAVREGGEGRHAVIQVDGAQACQAQHGIKMFQYGIQPVDDIISGGINMAGIQAYAKFARLLRRARFRAYPALYSGLQHQRVRGRHLLL